MPKKKSRRSTGRHSQNPKMVAEPANPTASINGEEEGEGDKESQIPNPITIQDQKLVQNPKSIDVDTEEDLGVQNPKSIDVEKNEELEIRNPKSIDVDRVEEDLKIQNPDKSIDVEEDLGVENPKSIDVDGEEDLGTRNAISIDEEELENRNPSEIERVDAKGGKLEDDVDQEVEHQKEELQEKHQQQQEGEEDKKQENQEPEGMDVSPLRSAPPPQDTVMCDYIPESVPPSISRKGITKRKKPMNKNQKLALEKKLASVKEHLKPIPFVPGKILDFSKHEELLKRLGLWDFAHIEFNQEIRTDLLISLLASYSSQLRYSTVNDCRIKVSRADLARALKLPLKKDKAISMETLDSDVEPLSQEAISFIGDFYSNWILLHEDMWMMPNEVRNWTEFVRTGQPQKIDWASLIWFMVDKELAQVPVLGCCYYASHLQLLMKSQKPELFEEEPQLEVHIDDREEPADVKTESLEDFQCQGSERQYVELSLGLDNNEGEQQFVDGDVTDFQQCKEEPGDPSHRLFDEKNDVSDHCLRRCNMNDLQDLEGKHTMEGETEEGRYEFSSKCAGLERLASTGLLQAMDTTDISYSPPIHLPDHSSGEFFQPQADTYMDPAGPSVFSNGCKRELSHDEDFSGHQMFNDQHKRMRNDEHWDLKPPDFEFCMDQMNSLMSKARMMYAAKEQECMTSHMNHNMMISQLQQEKDHMMHSYNKILSELRKRNDENYKLEEELRVMSDLLEGYRKALRENRRAFSEYRERNPLPEESIYKDVDGSGGLVLSTMELQKLRRVREEEEKLQLSQIEGMVSDFLLVWTQSLDPHLNHLTLMGERLSELVHEVGLLKEIVAKRKMPENPPLLNEVKQV